MKRPNHFCAIFLAFLCASVMATSPDARAGDDNLAQTVRDAIKSKDGVQLAQLAPSSYGALLVCLKDKDVDVRLGAVEAIASYHVRDAKSVEPLLESLKDEDKRVRQRVASAFYRLHDQRAVEPLIALLKDIEPDVCGTAADTLGELGDVRAVEPLLALLQSEKDKQSSAEYMAVSALGRLGDRRAVEPLLGVLASARSSSVRAAAAESLGRLGDKRAFDPLVAALRSPDAPDLRIAAARGLGKAGDPDAIEPLIVALDDANYQVVHEAVIAIGNLKDVRAVKPLCDFLNDRNRDGLYRSSVPDALRKLGDRSAIAPLIEATKDPNHFVRLFAANALTGFRWQPSTDLQRAYRAMATEKWGEVVKYGPAAVEPLLVALKTIDEPNCRQRAADDLEKLGWKPATETERAYLMVARRDWDDAAKLGPPAVEPLLLALAGGGRPGAFALNQSARDALHSIGPKAVDPLLTTLKTKDVHLGEMAAKMLGEMGGKTAVEPLIAVVKDEKNPEALREAAATALGQLQDKRAVEPLIAMLKDKSPGCRHRAVAALHELRDPRAIEPLTALLNDSDKVVRESVTFALTAMGKGPTADGVSRQLQDPNAEVRVAAARALAEMGDQRALEPSLLALRDTDPKVRVQAAYALRALGNKRAVEPLIAALKDENNGVRYTAAMALAATGDNRAVQPLISALADQDAWTRGGIAGALAALGDKRAIEPLRAALKRSDGTVITAVAISLACLARDESTVEPLLAALDHPDSEWVGLDVLGTVVFTLGPTAVKPLANGLQHKNPKVRQAVVEMLSLGGYDGATEVFMTALKDGNVAASVALQLAELDDPRAVGPLADALQNRQSAVWRPSGVRPAEKTDLGKTRTTGVAPDVASLIAVLRSDCQLSLAAAWVLGRQGDKRATEAMADALKVAERSGQSRGTWLYSQALARLGSPLALPPIIKFIKQESAVTAPPDETPEMRAWTARKQQKRTAQIMEAIVAVGEPAVEPLIALLKDENPLSRSLAAQGLGRLGDKRAINALKAALDDHDQSVRDSAAEAIRAIQRTD
jgi:HEAT repeat protein